jgi:hypothetical protein
MCSKILISYWASMSHVYFCVGDQNRFNSLFMSSFSSFPIPKCGQKINYFYNEFSIGYNNLEENYGFKVQNLTMFAKSCIKGYYTKPPSILE